MAVRHSSGHHAPVFPEIQLQVSVGPHNPGADKVQKLLHGLFQFFIRPHLIQVGIGLQDVQVGVHRLVRIDVVGAQGHIFQRGEIPGEGLDVSAVFLVGKIRLNHSVQVDGILEHLIVSGHLV